jgi:hypothetical protein
MITLCNLLRPFILNEPGASKKKRALILFGAGASLEYGAPSTAKLTNSVERAVIADQWMHHIGGNKAFARIKADLKKYFRHPDLVSFEHIYHCARELMFTFAPTPSAFDEFRPILYPFLDNKADISEDALRALAGKIISAIFTEVSASCGKNTISLAPLRSFIELLRRDYIIRIYTTNYDDFTFQAVPELYAGFDPGRGATPKRFELDGFWDKADVDSLFHLHGSVHMGFFIPRLDDIDFLGELFWFDDREEALEHSSFSGSEYRRMDGASVPPTPIITGLDKLSGLQQRPFSHFYSAMARDMMLADVIFVAGSGLGDLHLNTWLHEARSREPPTPILFVDYWKGDFLHHATHDQDRKGIEMLHALKILIGGKYGGTKIGTAWTVSKGRTAAVWDKGFQAFLNAPNEHRQVLEELRFRR